MQTHMKFSLILILVHSYVRLCTRTPFETGERQLKNGPFCEYFDGPMTRETVCVCVWGGGGGGGEKKGGGGGGGGGGG